MCQGSRVPGGMGFSLRSPVAPWVTPGGRPVGQWSCLPPHKLEKPAGVLSRGTGADLRGRRGWVNAASVKEVNPTQEVLLRPLWSPSSLLSVTALHAQ